MRLIDADAIPVVSADPYEEAAFRDTIADMPTIDPVKRGEWIEDKYTRKCSSCGRSFWRREGDPWAYCPECGSRNVQDPEEDAR